MKKAWIISVSMGYGHQRTAYPLKGLAFDKIVNANSYSEISQKDKLIWENSRKFYEVISRFERIPVLGKISFSIYDYFQRILSFYPKRNLENPSFTLKRIYSLLKKGWGKDLIEKLKKENPTIPFISTFFIPAFMAEFFEYPGKIFCVVCDTDIARVWAPLEPKKSKIKYFAPTERVVERLKLYGVKPENIFLTGYPLPLENVKEAENDLKFRILNLDPEGKFRKNYQDLVEKRLGRLPENSSHSLTILFSIGGAGAQADIAFKIYQSLKEKIEEGKLKLIISVGIREKLKEYFLKKIKTKNIEILFEKEVEDYFEKFNKALRKTDILWTKPSELSFYSALGIPIIIAPPLGSQERSNLRWLLKSGYGMPQENPKYTNQWLFDWLKEGYLAEMAFEAFVEGQRFGTLKIKEIISK
jgi:UDP-N-acetylglucosamine:LPS N-acetylglucosamine transferase